jgi:hypothetical protein
MRGHTIYHNGIEADRERVIAVRMSALPAAKRAGEARRP